MFEELNKLVYTEEENVKKETATFGFKGIKINAKVVNGKNLEDMLKEEFVR